MRALLLRYSRMLWTLLLCSAAIAHFTHREFFVAYYPSYLPWPDVAIPATAVIEVVLAILLWLPSTVRWSWALIAALMLCYLPVHLYVVTHYSVVAHPSPAVPLWAGWVRLILHVPLIVWPVWMGRNVRASMATR